MELIVTTNRRLRPPQSAKRIAVRFDQSVHKSATANNKIDTCVAQGKHTFKHAWTFRQQQTYIGNETWCTWATEAEGGHGSCVRAREFVDGLLIPSHDRGAYH